MKIRGLDSKDYIWNLALYRNNRRDNCSSLHDKARTLLYKLFPCDKILEEVPLPGTGLYADFYINSRKLMIEVNGEQHYKENGFFHKTSMSFYKGMYRDKNKLKWCELNNIVLVALRFDEDEHEWTDRIKKAYNS